MAEHSFNVGDTVRIKDWGENDGSGIPATEDDKRYNGMTGPITNIRGDDIFVDIGEPGILFRDLICRPNELEKVETNG